MDWDKKDINWYAALQVRATAEDGARLVMHSVGVTHGHAITRCPKRYYVHGPRGVTDWHDTAEEAIAAYERMD